MSHPDPAERQHPAWATLGYLAGVVGQLVQLKIVAVFWGTAVFGEFSLVLAMVAGISVIFFGPFSQWVVRDYQGLKEEKSLRGLFRLINTYAFVASALVLVVAALAGPYGAGFAGIRPHLILVGAMLGIGATLNDLLSALFTAEALTRRSASYVAANHALRLAAVLGAYAWGLGVEGIVGALFAVQCVVFTVGYRDLVARLHERRAWGADVSSGQKRALQARMYRYSRPFFIWGIFGYLAAMGDRWILAEHVSASMLGVYSAMAFASMGLSNAIYAAVNRGVVPVVFRISGTGEDGRRVLEANRILATVLTGLISVSALLVSLSFLFPKLILTALTSREFVAYGSLLWIMMVAAAAFNLAQFLVTRGLIKQTPAMYLPSKFLHGVVTVGALLWLVPRFGVPGAVFAVLAGSVLNLVIVIYLNRGLAGRS